MRDKTHLEQVETWARFVRDHPTEWKAQHTAFINAQFDFHQRFVEQMRKQPNGEEKLRKLFLERK